MKELFIAEIINSNFIGGNISLPKEKYYCSVKNVGGSPHSRHLDYNQKKITDTQLLGIGYCFISC